MFSRRLKMAKGLTPSQPHLLHMWVVFKLMFSLLQVFLFLLNNFKITVISKNFDLSTFFQLAVPRPNLGHYLTHSNLITVFLSIFDPKVAGNPVKRLGLWAWPSNWWDMNREPSDSSTMYIALKLEYRLIRLYFAKVDLLGNI